MRERISDLIEALLERTGLLTPTRRDLLSSLNKAVDDLDAHKRALELSHEQNRKLREEMAGIQLELGRVELDLMDLREGVKNSPNTVVPSSVG